MKLPFVACIAGLVATVLLGASAAFAQAQPPARGEPASALTDHGDPNISALVRRLRGPGSKRLVVTQLGDSHTAADFFTGQLRRRLQADYGDGGIGWLPPMAVPGLLHEQAAIGTEGWTLLDSRSARDVDYPLGGLIARTGKAWSGSMVNAIREADRTDGWRMQLWLRGAPNDRPLAWRDAQERITPVPPVPGDGRWHAVAFPVRLPAILMVQQAPAYDLGGIVLERTRGSVLAPGAQVDAVGSNGVQAAFTDAWGADWMAMLRERNPDLVLLAFGTNEAHDWALDPARYQARLAELVGRLRATLPRAVLVLIGPPAQVSRAARNDPRCATPLPASLNAVHEAQRRVARQAQTLYWDWQQAMGGPCSQPEWRAKGWAAEDGIHLTPEGYRQAADRFRDDLKRLSGI